MMISTFLGFKPTQMSPHPQHQQQQSGNVIINATPPALPSDCKPQSAHNLNSNPYPSSGTPPNNYYGEHVKYPN